MTTLFPLGNSYVRSASEEISTKTKPLSFLKSILFPFCILYGYDVERTTILFIKPTLRLQVGTRALEHYA